MNNVKSSFSTLTSLLLGLTFSFQDLDFGIGIRVLDKKVDV